MKKAICELVDQYLKVETLFQVNLTISRNIDKVEKSRNSTN